jgi:hypothetical protein
MNLFEKKTLALWALVAMSACNGTAQQLTLASNGHSDYKIIIPESPSKLEQRSAVVLQSYLQRVSGVQLPIVNENGITIRPAIYIGHTVQASKVVHEHLAAEASLVQAEGKNIIFMGGSGRGLIYGIYGFLENYLGCKKISSDAAIISAKKEVTISGSLHDEHKPQFTYREVYYPASHDAEFLEWNQLQQFEDLWGLWGHSYNKLVPAQTYFKTNPEYYALVKGRRQPSQLCLSNEAVFKIVVDGLKKRMSDNPDALYWSVSPNDDNGYCQCDLCRATDEAQGSPSGSLIKFVNRVAAQFPDKKITTLAYGYTHHAPKSLKPADNVYIFLSDIDAYRDKPLAEEGSAGAFRTDIKAWGALTPNLFVWDYITQFTNYLAPFPNFHTLGSNMQYLKDNGVKGIFEQGSGDTYSEWAELRSYVMAKLLENDKADVKQLVSSFLKSYYGDAAKYLQQYADLYEEKMIASRRKLDIYGNPINEWNAWLSPELLDQYSSLFDKAEAAVEGNAVYSDRVMRARLPLEYTVLQQARFYGIEKFGFWVKDNSGSWLVKPKFTDKVARFAANCKKAGVTELSEGGLNPDQYLAEWNTIFKTGVTPTKAIGAAITLQYPFADDYPAKGNRTLTDGNPGYNDFSYNWLCFYGTPMIATIDLGKAQSVTQVKMHFLDDPRHWIFLPESVKIEVSSDGVSYHEFADLKSPVTDEHYELTIKDYTGQGKATARYIRVSAKNLSALPVWRYKDNKKPMIACDEIYVQ